MAQDIQPPADANCVLSKLTNYLMMLRFLKLFIAVLITASVSGQDIHFSQFYMSPLNLNPAMTGVLNCKTRMVANYRNQWSAALAANAYNTYSVSYDQKMPVGREDYFGIGGTLWGDVAGESRFGSTSGRMSLSYSRKMAGYRKRASYLVFGAEGGIVQRRISQADLRWPTQITSDGVFDPTIDPRENLTDTDGIYGDLGAGLLWFSVIDDNTNWFAGAAVHHLNRPNVSFYGGDETLYSRYTLHAGGQFETAPRISWIPNIIFMAQGPHRELNLGTSVRFALGPSRTSNQSWQVGGWYRVGTKTSFSPADPDSEVDAFSIHSDAIIFSTRFNYDQFGIGFSYDLNISELQGAAAGNGAFEFSLTYDICGPETRGVYCPRF